LVDARRRQVNDLQHVDVLVQGLALVDVAGNAVENQELHVRPVGALADLARGVVLPDVDRDVIRHEQTLR
jgi:hypothetical protein